MKLKTQLATLIFCLFLCSAGLAQQQFPSDTATTFLDKYRPASYLALAAEGSFTNYGFTIGVPVFWIEERVKIVPSVGLFWQDFVTDGFNFNPAAGGKFLYYFNKQLFGHSLVNSLYAGVGGIATVTNFLGREVTQQSRAGLILGYDYSLNSSVSIAPELHLGINANEEFLPAIGLVLHFGR